MNSTNDTTTKPGTEDNKHKIAGWAIVLIIIYLIWNQ